MFSAEEKLPHGYRSQMRCLVTIIIIIWFFVKLCHPFSLTTAFFFLLNIPQDFNTFRKYIQIIYDTPIISEFIQTQVRKQCIQFNSRMGAFITHTQYLIFRFMTSGLQIRIKRSPIIRERLWLLFWIDKADRNSYMVFQSLKGDRKESWESWDFTQDS